MGIGLILVCPPALVDPVIDDLRTRGEAAVVIGEIHPGPTAVTYA
jgi:phosphoribosylaminoimidazole (AIR) synthetase